MNQQQQQLDAIVMAALESNTDNEYTLAFIRSVGRVSRWLERGVPDVPSLVKMQILVFKSVPEHAGTPMRAGTIAGYVEAWRCLK